MAATAEGYIKLAQSLPPQLLRFFTRYKPRVVGYPEIATPSFSSSTSTGAPSHVAQKATTHPTLKPSRLLSPFVSFKDPRTGERRHPIYSLRRQADLVKMARANGVEELLPYTSKGTDARIERRAKHGLRVKGTGVGQKVKGKKWERMMRGKLEKTKEAMEGMPKLIQEWKEVSNSMFL